MSNDFNFRYKPVEALKTALEGSPPVTNDERCKVRINYPLNFTIYNPCSPQKDKK